MARYPKGSTGNGHSKTPQPGNGASERPTPQQLTDQINVAIREFNETLDLAERQLAHLRQLRVTLNMSVSDQESRLGAILNQQAVMGAAVPLSRAMR